MIYLQWEEAWARLDLIGEGDDLILFASLQSHTMTGGRILYMHDTYRLSIQG